MKKNMFKVILSVLLVIAFILPCVSVSYAAERPELTQYGFVENDGVKIEYGQMNIGISRNRLHNDACSERRVGDVIAQCELFGRVEPTRQGDVALMLLQCVN